MFNSKAKLWISTLAVMCLSATAAYGQATRTWVSGVGDDVNPCSRTAPCKTFAGAISKTAPGGEIDVLDPGGFGAVTITKSITIDGSPFTSGVLVSGTAGIIVNAAPTDIVTLRGLDFDGLAGNGTKGIQIIQAGRVVIEDCEIYGFAPRAISVEPSANPVQVYVSRTRVKSSYSNGIVVQPASPSIRAQVTINNVEITEATNFGLSVTAGGVVTVRNSTLVDNGPFSAAGIRVDGTGGAVSVDLDNVLINGSNTGILTYTGATVRVNNSSILNCGTGLSVTGGSILSFGNNRLAGNTSNGSFTGPITLQ